jgi:hypothetical protein
VAADLGGHPRPPAPELPARWLSTAGGRSPGRATAMYPHSRPPAGAPGTDPPSPSIATNVLLPVATVFPFPTP